MDYIQKLEDLGITFEGISKDRAVEIMKTEYSYHKLVEYSEIFDKYKRTINKGKFVNLDFSQLYCLAQIDSRLSKIFMCMCLEIENGLKTRLLYDANMVDDNKNFYKEYYTNEKKYFEMMYNADNMEIIKLSNYGKSIGDLELYNFLNILQFGTLENLIHFFYKKYAKQIYGGEFAPFEKQIHSVRRIRNLVAHNTSIINRITIKSNYKNLDMSVYLGKNGIKNKTLTTNLSKLLVSDLCNVLYVYFSLIIDKKEILMELEAFDSEYGKSYQEMFSKNPTLISVYTFIKNVIRIFVEDGKKN